ncbi:MAG: phenylalanine--tRNA ligase subunit alpha [Minisyncoccia bacterium]
MDTVKGHMHPISSLIRKTNQVFFDLGFTFVEYPLVESEYYNFDVINVPKDHPARDMQDTFFMKDESRMLLRTQMSGIQVHYMEDQRKKGIMPPYRIVYPGKVFRNEATDMTHEAEFFQIEWMVIEEGVTLGSLRWTIEKFLSAIFEASAEVRFRPSFFPFTEPSLEVDMRFSGEHVPEKLRNRWIEIMGAGMVHPNVIRNAGLDPEKYHGFAFAVGLDRIALLKWGIDDIRLMHSADLRFINQF